MATTGTKVGRPIAQITKPAVDHSSEGIPEVPNELTPYGKELWNFIWESGDHLDRQRDILLVQNICEKFEELKNYKKQLKDINLLKKKEYKLLKDSDADPFTLLAKEKEIKLGDMYEGSNHAYAPYPQVRLIQEGRAQIVSWLIELQFTPTHAPDFDGDEELNEFMKQDR